MTMRFQWECGSCGADQDSKAYDCCDNCLLTFYAGKHSPDLDTAFSKYEAVSDWVNDQTDYEE